MEENNNQIKMKLTTIIVLTLIAVAIIIGIIFAVNKNNKSDISESMEITQEENTKAEANISDENEHPDLPFEFLKMENKEENMIYSPLSIKYALKMLNDGASGNTKAQIEKVIGNTNLTKYNNINDVLSFANTLYIRNTYSQYVKDEYKNKLLNRYNAEIKYDDFKSANNINNWIEDKTFGQIKNMLKDDIVTNPLTELLLINALAIEMSWKDSFDGKDTHGRTFYLENGEEINATMMYQETKSDCISYYKDSNITAISMDLEQYEDEQMQFIAIMPDSDLSSYVENFGADTLENITNNLTLASKTENGLDIFIPRFSFDYDLPLKKDLINMGITDAFNEDIADFSNMTNSPERLYVYDALHKANIDFTEKGIKAAAATVIVMQTESAIADRITPEKIEINKPFMYLIRDKKTDEIWFVGTVYEPNLWENDKADYEYR